MKLTEEFRHLAGIESRLPGLHEAGTDVNINRLERFVATVENQLRELRHSLDLYKKNPEKYKPQLSNFKAAVNTILGMGRVVMRLEDRETSGYRKGKVLSEDRVPPAKTFKAMEDAVDTMLKARVKIRAAEDALANVANDALWTDNYQDKGILNVRDRLRDLDNDIGRAFRDVEHLQKMMKKMAL